MSLVTPTNIPNTLPGSSLFASSEPRIPHGYGYRGSGKTGARSRFINKFRLSRSRGKTVSCNLALSN